MKATLRRSLVPAAVAALLLSTASGGSPSREAAAMATAGVSRTSIGLACCGISYPPWQTTVDRTRDFDAMASLGVKWIRTDAQTGWLGELDEIVSHASRRGIEVTACIGCTVTRGGSFDGSPASLARYRQFARDVAARHPSIRVWEVFNEPDRHGWTPETYLPYLRAGRAGIKDVNPSAVVSHGGIATWDSHPCKALHDNLGGCGMVEWMKRLYAIGGRGSFDAMAVHLYGDPFLRADWNLWEWAFARSESVRSVMDGNGDSSVPVWSNETGEDTGDDEAQATIVANDFKALEVYPLAAMAVYTLKNDADPDYGLIQGDYRWRPSAFAYRDGVASSATSGG